MKQRAKKNRFSSLFLISKLAVLIYGLSSLLLLGTALVQAADLSQDMAECATIENDAERLKCYDQLVGRGSKKVERTNEPAETTPKEKEEESYFSQLWELDPETRGGKFPIRPYRSNYILPFTYNFLPNAAAVQEDDPDMDVQRTEVEFQLSVR